MSDMSSFLAAGLSALAVIKGESVGYRTGTSGTFTTLTGWVMNQDRVQAGLSDSDHGDEIQRRSAILKGPLTPVLVKGYQIQDAITSLVWAVQSVKTDTQQTCLLELVTVQRFTPNRHGAA